MTQLSGWGLAGCTELLMPWESPHAICPQRSCVWDRSVLLQPRGTPSQKSDSYLAWVTEEIGKVKMLYNPFEAYRFWQPFIDIHIFAMNSILIGFTAYLPTALADLFQGHIENLWVRWESTVCHTNTWLWLSDLLRAERAHDSNI